MGASHTLDFLYDTRWEDLPDRVKDMSVVCLRDLLGVAAGSLQTDASSLIRNHAVAHFGAGVRRTRLPTDF